MVILYKYGSDLLTMDFMVDCMSYELCMSLQCITYYLWMVVHNVYLGLGLGSVMHNHVYSFQSSIELSILIIDGCLILCYLCTVSCFLCTDAI